ncbi:hypothetical protein BKA93DRAFT_822277 [Sparassis latifolia]
MSENPPVVLEPNSLYLSTEILMSDGFHYALFVTDANGASTRHDWAEDLSRETPERYFHRSIDSVATYTPEGRLIFAYFKVRGYVPPPPDFDWVAEFSGIFPNGSYPSWIENRKHKMSCRTWVLRALALLRDRGALTRSDKVTDIEAAIEEQSQALEKGLGNAAEGEEYHARVLEV